MKSLSYIPASDGSGDASLMTITQVRTAPATTITVNTVTGVPSKFFGTMGTPHTFTDPVTGETITVISEATAVNFAGHIDSGKIEIDAIAPGETDLGSKVGDIIIIRPTTQWADNIHDILSESLNDDGTLKNKSVTLPKINGGTTTGVLTTDASGNVTAGGAWASWTPTLTNITLGNGTVVAKYSQVGKTVKYKLSFTMGTTSAMGSVPKFSLPVTAAAIPGTSNGIVIGRGSIWDFGTNNFDAVVVYETTTLAAVRVLNAASTNVVQSNITSTNPMTWTSTDELHVYGEYEAA